MSDRARDVVRYLKALENGPVYRSVWVASRYGGYWQLAVPTADTSLALRGGWPLGMRSQIAWGLEYIRQRYGGIGRAAPVRSADGYRR